MSRIFGVALLVSAGCQEMKEVFAPLEEFEDTRSQEQDRARLAQNAEQARLKRLEARALKLGRRGRSKMGPEPEAMPAKVKWLVQNRLKCEEAECSEKLLKRLEGLGPGIVPHLMAVTGEADIPLVLEAVRLVGLLELRGAAPAVGKMLGHKNAAVRGAAAATLGWLKDESAAVPLAERLRVVRKPDERRAIISALAGLPGPVALKALASLTMSRDFAEARAAVAGLSRHKEEAAVKALDGAIALAESPSVKRAALQALADIGTAKAKGSLKRHAKSRDPAVREAARALIKKQ